MIFWDVRSENQPSCIPRPFFFLNGQLSFVSFVFFSWNLIADDASFALCKSSDQKLLEKYMVLVFCEGLYLNTIKYVIVSYATEGPLLEESLRIIIFSLGIACMIFQACGQSIHEACYRTLWQDLVLKLLWSRKNGFQKRKKKKKRVFIRINYTKRVCSGYFWDMG